MRRLAGLMLVLALLLGVATAEEVARDRVRAPGKPEGQVTAFTPQKGRRLKQMQVEETAGGIKRVIFHRSPTCHGPYGVLFDGRPAMGQLMSGLPEKDTFYIKVIGVGDLVLIPEYR
ncbi:MAG: hypothetical protein AB1758_18635 [Candidatus Eremiobacterota bacterium]